MINPRQASFSWNGLVGGLFLLALVLPSSSTAFDADARNVFALADVDRPLPNWVWNEKWIAGVALRAYWRTLEPRRGRYDWRILDAEIAKAAAAGKVVTIRVWGGARGTPDWVYQAGARSYEWTVTAAAQPEYGARLTAPLPWDPVWLREWARFIAALGKKFNANPHVAGIVMAGPVGPYGEMVLPRSKEMRVGWKDLGWDDDRFFGAYKACIDAYAAALPDKRLALSFSRPGDEPAAVAFRIYEYARNALGARFLAMMNALSGIQDYRKFEIDSKRFHQGIIATLCDDGKSGNPVGFQQLAPRTLRTRQQLRPGQEPFAGVQRMGAPEREIANLEACNARYVEVYLADLQGGPTTLAYRRWAEKSNQP